MEYVQVPFLYHRARGLDNMTGFIDVEVFSQQEMSSMTIGELLLE